MEKAFSTYQLVLFLITECKMPVVINESTMEPGYVKGFFSIINWKDATLSCLIPVEAKNSDDIKYTYKEGYDEVEGQEVSSKRVVDINLITNFSNVIRLKVSEMTATKDFVYLNAWHLLE